MAANVKRVLLVSGVKCTKPMDIKVSAYRTSAHDPNTIVFSQESKVKKFKYVELKERQHSYDKCQLCNSSHYGSTYKEEHCHPNKRVVISGFLWWKALCPLYSVHVHYTCLKCKALFIYEVFNEKAVREVSVLK